MAIQDSDLFLIDDAGVSKKIRADKLKGGLDSTYANMKLLVNKPDYSSRFIYCKDLQSNLPDDHWLMVERSSVSYKVNGTDVHDYFPSGPADQTGVITDSHTTPIVQGETGTHDLTVASLATPNFVDNESIRMVSAAGETSSYVPVTNTITNVKQDPNGELTVTTFAASSNQSVLATLPTPFGADGNFLPTSAIDKNLYFNNNSETEGGGPNVWTWSGAPIGTELHMHFTQIGEGFRIEDVVGTISQIRYFDVDGNDITSGNPIVDGSTADSSAGPAGHNNPPKIIQFTLGSADGSFKFRAGSYTRIYTQDWYVPNDIRLTFADPSPDVKFFQPGDLVRDGSYYENHTSGELLDDGSKVTVLNPDKAFDGIFSLSVGGSGDVAWQNNSATLEQYKSVMFLDIGEIAGISGPVEILSYPVNNGYNFEFSLGIDGTTIATVNTQSNTVTYTDGRPSETYSGWVKVADDASTVTTIDIKDDTRNAYPRLQAIRINGVVLADTGEDVKVISRDPVANTMIVDGGSWLGSDGTNSGDAADQETIVTGPAKSGTAKTDGIPASTTFRIKDSNGQWVDNTNSNSGADHSGSSAQEFYVKNASGRVALARLDP